MLVLPRETFPTFRVDIEILFGRQLLARGHAIDFVMQATSEGTPTGAQYWNGRTVWVGRTDSADGFSHRLRKHWLGICHDLASLRHATRERYDAVQVKDKFLIAAVAVVLARLRGLKLFFWLSFPIPESQRMRATERSARYPCLARLRGAVTDWLLYRWILPGSDHVFVQSQRMKEDISSQGADPSKITVVPMGIDILDFPVSTKQVMVKQDRSVRLGYLGVLSAERRLDILPEILAQLLHAGFDVSLLIVGDGNLPQERIALERRAVELGVRDRLEITGFLPRPEALARISNTDICLSPFYPTPILESTSPTKLVEYLALGIPVVASRHPEQRFVLRESRGGVCVPWGAAYFVRAIRWLMRHSEAERIAMGARGRQWVKSYRTYDRIADDLEHEYQRLLQSAVI